MTNPEEAKMQALFKAAGAAQAMSTTQLEQQWNAVATRVAAKPALNAWKVWTAGGAVVALGALIVALRPVPVPAAIAEVSMDTPVVNLPAGEPPVAEPAPAIRKEPEPLAQRLRTVKTKATPAPVNDDALLAEAQFVARAAQTLRAQHNAPGTLAMLNEHEKRFSPPALKDEARLLRIEALMAEQQPQQALAVLRTSELSNTPRTETMRLLEAELLSQLNQCGEALKKLEPLSATTVSRSVQERALINRAACAHTVGDFQSSRRALEQYLERFPSGSFAEEARQRLESLP